MGKKEGIAQVSEASINKVRVIGRDGIGREIVVKLPTMLSEVFLDRAGGYVYIPLQCHRVVTAQAAEEYTERQRRRWITEDGKIPVRECPHTVKYADWTKGPLAAPDKGVRACSGGKVVKVDPYGQEAADMAEEIEVDGETVLREVVYGIYDPWGKRSIAVLPCKHLITIRERLRTRAADEARIRRTLAKADQVPDAFLKMAEEMKTQNEMLMELAGIRGNLSAGKGEVDEA